MIKQFDLPIGEVATLPAKPKPAYSFSQLETGECLAKYKYEYIERLPRKLTFSLVAGSMLDCAFNAYYRDNGHLHEPHDQRMDYAKVALEMELADHPEWSEIPWSKKPGDVRSSPNNFINWLFDAGALALVCRPERGPVEVQTRLDLALANYTIVGYLDCLETERRVVVDVKMVGNADEMSQLGYMLRAQVPLYRHILWKTRRIKTTGVYELLTATKTPKLVVVEDPEDSAILKNTLKKFVSHHRRINKLSGELRNASCCIKYNSKCAHLNLCWPKISQQLEKQNPKT